MEKITCSLTTRLLHLLLALTVTHQLIVSLFMQKPEPRGKPENLGFELHEIVGIAGFVILIAYWIWILVRRSEHGITALIPWFSATHRKSVVADFRWHWNMLKTGALPAPPTDFPFASAVHGLGLLTATAMAVTGVIVYATMAPNGALVGIGAIAINIHGLMASLMWAYFIGHVAVALLHQMKGHAILQKMFSLKKY